MKILIAEDDAVSRKLLESNLHRWGHEAVSCKDGDQAWAYLEQPDTPRLAILDWMMPGIEGPELCRRARELRHGSLLYLILLTAKGDEADLVQGLQAGADDYMLGAYRLYLGGALVNVGPGRGEAPVWGGNGTYMEKPYQTLDVTPWLPADGGELLVADHSAREALPVLHDVGELANLVQCALGFLHEGVDALDHHADLVLNALDLIHEGLGLFEGERPAGVGGEPGGSGFDHDLGRGEPQR